MYFNKYVLIQVYKWLFSAKIQVPATQVLTV